MIETPEFDEATHTYRIAGRVVPGVTSILSTCGLIDATWFNEAARWRGTAVHRACQFDDEGDLSLESVSCEIQPYLEAWRSFKANCQWASLEIEKPFWSPEGFCGTPDRVGVLGGRPTTLDIKTSVNAYPWVGLQLAGYSLLASERLGASAGFIQRVAVCLRPDGDYNLTRFTDRRDIEVFRAAVKLAAWKKENGK